MPSTPERSSLQPNLFKEAVTQKIGERFVSTPAIRVIADLGKDLQTSLIQLQRNEAALKQMQRYKEKTTKVKKIDKLKTTIRRYSRRLIGKTELEHEDNLPVDHTLREHIVGLGFVLHALGQEKVAGVAVKNTKEQFPDFITPTATPSPGNRKEEIDPFQKAVTPMTDMPDAAITVIAGIGRRYLAASLAQKRGQEELRPDVEASEQVEGLQFVLEALGQDNVLRTAHLLKDHPSDQDLP